MMASQISIVARKWNLQQSDPLLWYETPYPFTNFKLNWSWWTYDVTVKEETRKKPWHQLVHKCLSSCLIFSVSRFSNWCRDRKEIRKTMQACSPNSPTSLLALPRPWRRRWWIWWCRWPCRAPSCPSPSSRAALPPTLRSGFEAAGTQTSYDTDQWLNSEGFWLEVWWNIFLLFT